MTMLCTAEKPLIVAGGGGVNADACALLVQVAEAAGIPVIPPLMGWGSIPDHHPLMAGMVGLQTSHRYGNATMRASDFVLGIGKRWANHHSGSPVVYCKGRRFIHIDIEPTQIGRVFAPDLGLVSDAGAALAMLVDVAREWKAAGKPPDWTAWAAECRARKRSVDDQCKTNYDSVPMKPPRVYQCLVSAFGKVVCCDPHRAGHRDRQRGGI